MTELEIVGLTERYGSSIYVAFVPREQIADGRQIPKVQGDELISAMEENIRGAERILEAAKERHERARRDGLFDPDVHKTAPKSLRKKFWDAAVNVRADLQRAISEVAHWQEYVQWAWKQKQRALPQREPGEDDE